MKKGFTLLVVLCCIGNTITYASKTRMLTNGINVVMTTLPATKSVYDYYLKKDTPQYPLLNETTASSDFLKFFGELTHKYGMGNITVRLRHDRIAPCAKKNVMFLTSNMLQQYKNGNHVYVEALAAHEFGHIKERHSQQFMQTAVGGSALGYGLVHGVKEIVCRSFGLARLAHSLLPIAAVVSGSVKAKIIDYFLDTYKEHQEFQADQFVIDNASPEVTRELADILKNYIQDNPSSKEQKRLKRIVSSLNNMEV